MKRIISFVQTGLVLILFQTGLRAVETFDFGPAETRTNSDLDDAQRKATDQGAYNLRVRYVKVDARWADSLKLPLTVGDTLTPETLSQAMNVLRSALTTNGIGGAFTQSRGEIGIFYLSVDFDTNQPSAVLGGESGSANSVGVIFRPFYLRISLIKIGDNVLPVPRSATPIFNQGVPWPLRTFQPNFNATYDRAFGAAIGGSLDTDLLHLTDSQQNNVSLDLQAQASKSLQKPFYRADAGLNYSKQQVDSIWFNESARAEYNGFKEPMGDTSHLRNAGFFGGGIGLKLAPNTRLWIDTGYRRTEDSLGKATVFDDGNSEANELPSRLLFEAIPPRIYGFFRASLWEENGWQTGSGGSYQRLVGRIGYSKEIPIGQNQSVGLETIVGGGKLWGDTPASSHFFGGNSQAQFLYAGASSDSLINTPAGPLIRSFGGAEAGFRSGRNVIGGNAFWHVNVNLSLPIPIPGSFEPLIPNEITDLEDTDGNPLTIKQILNNQVTHSGPNLLAAALRAKDPSLSQSEALAKAKNIMAEVEPAADFIINDANLYSIKPVLMFDAAGLSGRSHSTETWLAVGGGIQLTLVTARFEIGYMHTLSGPTFGDRGNIFARLVFQNLF